jgi:hypothetical protein
MKRRRQLWGQFVGFLYFERLIEEGDDRTAASHHTIPAQTPCRLL